MEWVRDAPAGYSQVMPSQPMAKQVLKAKRKTVWAIPALVPPMASVTARIIIHTDIPAAPKSISFLRPNFSIVKTANQDAMKYSVPLQAAMSFAWIGVRPTSFWSTFGI